jgi:hypothetical protein
MESKMKLINEENKQMAAHNERRQCGRRTLTADKPEQRIETNKRDRYAKKTVDNTGES